jgi:uncharacterized protein
MYPVHSTQPTANYSPANLPPMHTNHLIHETSPYLLQHAHNPVEWYAWKPEAFDRARRENKPILVSIGYSTCHWCHVMERESFEKEAVAALMNELFVCIKVDREERPDVDQIYMEACQIISGNGGWPLNCFLMPDGRPFFAGTYYPPVPAYNRPSWSQVLQNLATAYRDRPDTVEEQANRLLGYLSKSDNSLVQTANIGDTFFTEKKNIDVLDTLFETLRARFDRANGGFGGAPKFPSSMTLHFLLHYQAFTQNAEFKEEAMQHVTRSLDKMILGGIYDQLGGGFARYATDAEWLVPHFEKMLYDNALLVSLLADAYKATKKTLYKTTIEETLAYIKREMTAPDGGFYTALDADSEGVEGKFYVWQKTEIDALLGEDATLFCDFYDVTEEGNWEETNILWRDRSAEDYCQRNQLEIISFLEKIEKNKQILFDYRKKRIHPGLDDKQLLSWNALQVSAYCHAYTALGNEEYKTIAVNTVDFILEKFNKEIQPQIQKSNSSVEPKETETQIQGSNSNVEQPETPIDRSEIHNSSFITHHSFHHTYKNGIAQYDAFLEDYAYLIAALLDVYRCTFDTHYLTKARVLTDFVLANFWDAEQHLFYFTAATQTDILLRRKELYDNAMPSGNSTMLLNLQQLALIFDEASYKNQSEKMLAALQNSITKFPTSFGRWAMGLLQAVVPSKEIAVSTLFAQ